MKVKLAAQLMSDSVARALKWAYNEKIEGFHEEDCLVTAEFLELHDKLFDILNSRTILNMVISTAPDPSPLHLIVIAYPDFSPFSLISL